MSVKIFWDCGAPSIYNALSCIRGTGKGPPSAHIRHWGRDDFSYVDTKEYREYRDGYLATIKADAGRYITSFPNLDVVHNAELTYKNQKWFEKRGVRPLPVWHLGSDLKWLKKYLSEGYEYMCIGGLVPNPTAVLRPSLDNLFSRYLCDSKGMPRMKYHGFGMTSLELMLRHPWYSVDSKSWTDYGRYGMVIVPYRRGGKWDYTRPPFRLFVSDRGANLRSTVRHIRFTLPSVRDMVFDYIKELGIEYGKSNFRREQKGYKLTKDEFWSRKPHAGHDGIVERVEESGIRSDFMARTEVNIHTLVMMERHAKPWPWPFVCKHPAGKVGLLS